MADARAGAHHLDIAGLRAALVAETVLVADGTKTYVGDDLHVAVRMQRETAVGGYFVIVPDHQCAPVGALRMVIVGKGEVMAGI